MRRVRQAGRADAQQARRRGGHRELRDGEGVRHPHRRRHRRADPGRRRTCGLHRGAADPASSGRDSGSGPRAPRPGAGLRSAGAAGRRHRDGACAAVRLLAVGVARADDGRRRVGRAAVPPRRAGEPAARDRLDGHPRLGGDAGRVRLVALRPAVRRRRCTRTPAHVRHHPVRHGWRGAPVPRGRRRGHRVRARRPLRGGTRPPALRGRAGRADGAGRDGGVGRARRPRGARAGRAGRGRRPLRRPARREDRDRR